jgi:cytochrome b pre-mRNA-processing protein 3
VANGWIGAWRARRARAATAHTLYVDLVAQARAPVFYADWGVPDTIDGRLEMVALHAALVMRRLAGGDLEARELAQALFDVMFADIDRNLRELGVGDLSVGKKVKGIAGSFFGRAAALEQALTRGDRAAVAELIERNVYMTGPRASGEQIAALVQYVLDWERRLADRPIGELFAGRLPGP